MVYFKKQLTKRHHMQQMCEKTKVQSHGSGSVTEAIQDTIITPLSITQAFDSIIRKRENNLG